MQTHDIDTTTVQAPPAITDARGLSDAIFEMATQQLIINAAETELQTTTEIAKKAFADATEAPAAKVRQLMAGVEAYAKANRATLFPGKKKSISILQHSLSYRSSESVVVVDEKKAVAEIENCLKHDSCAGELYHLLLRVLRQPPQEIDKDAVKSAGPDGQLILRELFGVGVVRSESFKVTFNFTPEAQP